MDVHMIYWESNTTLSIPLIKSLIQSQKEDLRDFSINQPDYQEARRFLSDPGSISSKDLNWIEREFLFQTLDGL